MKKILVSIGVICLLILGFVYGKKLWGKYKTTRFLRQQKAILAWQDKEIAKLDIGWRRRTKAINELLEDFDKNTDAGKKVAEYENQLEEKVEAVTKASEHFVATVVIPGIQEIKKKYNNIARNNKFWNSNDDAEREMAQSMYRWIDELYDHLDPYYDVAYQALQLSVIASKYLVTDISVRLIEQTGIDFKQDKK